MHGGAAAVAWFHLSGERARSEGGYSGALREVRRGEGAGDRSAGVVRAMIVGAEG